MSRPSCFHVSPLKVRLPSRASRVVAWYQSLLSIQAAPPNNQLQVGSLICFPGCHLTCQSAVMSTTVPYSRRVTQWGWPTCRSEGLPSVDYPTIPLLGKIRSPELQCSAESVCYSPVFSTSCRHVCLSGDATGTLEQRSSGFRRPSTLCYSLFPIPRIAGVNKSCAKAVEDPNVFWASNGPVTKCDSNIA